MATIVLEAKKRSEFNSAKAKTLRSEGYIPCIIYGDNRDPEEICIASDLLNKYAKKSNFFSTVFEIKNVDKKGQKFVAKDLQYHPVTDLPIHADFLRVGAGSKVEVRVPIKFVHEEASPGLKLGGVLNVLVHEIDVVCDPEKIPDKIEIDLTGFEFHHTVHSNSVDLPEGITLPVGAKNFTIATVVAPTLLKKEEEEQAQATSSEGTVAKSN